MKNKVKEIMDNYTTQLKDRANVNLFVLQLLVPSLQ